MMHLVCAIFGVWCEGGTLEVYPQMALPRVEITVSHRDVRYPLLVEVADEERERRIGMMGRRYLPAGAGMLFVWPRPVRTKFWMRQTVIPLDILFFYNNALTYVVAEAQPMDETEVGPEGVSDMVLEVPAGTAVAWGLEPGMQLVREGWRLDHPFGGVAGGR